MVEKAFEHLVYHAEMIVVALELPFEVDEVGGRGMETLGEEPGNAIGDLRMRPQESGGVLELVDRRAGCRAHRRRVGPGEEPDISPKTAPGALTIATTVSPRVTSIVPSFKT